VAQDRHSDQRDLTKRNAEFRACITHSAESSTPVTLAGDVTVGIATFCMIVPAI
jgi:hypothetical protein